MQISIGVTDVNVLLTFPVCSADAPLRRALYRSSNVRADDLNWDMLEHEPQTLAVPLVGWRYALRSIKRGYDVTVQMEMELKADKPSVPTYEPKRPGRSVHRGVQAPAQTPFDNPDPMTFLVKGVVYNDVRQIPSEGHQSRDVGSFSLTQPKLIAIDPCYTNVTREAVAMTALPGIWKAQVVLRDELNGFGVARLVVRHESVLEDHPSLYAPDAAGVAGVDSGQCGFFDDAYYPRDAKAHEHEDGTFYKGCCDATDCAADLYTDATREVPAGIIPGAAGVNSRTLIGDGGYRCMVRKDAQGVVIAAVLVFDYYDTAFPDSELEEEDADEELAG